MVTKTLIAAITATVLMIPAAQAQYRGDGPRHAPPYMQPQKPSLHGPSRHVIQRQQAVRHHWKRGQRVANWRRHSEVRDWNRHGLRRPGPGQRWVRVDNRYLLIGVTSGIIAALAAAR